MTHARVSDAKSVATETKESVEPLAAIKSAFACLSQKPSVEEEMQLLKSISECDKEKYPPQQNFEIAVIKAKIHLAYYQDFEVMRVREVASAVKKAIQEALQKSVVPEIRIDWSEGLFLFQAASFLVDGVALAISYCEEALETVATFLLNRPRRGYILSSIAQQLNDMHDKLQKELEIESQPEVKMKNPKTIELKEKLFIKIGALFFKCCTAHFAHAESVAIDPSSSLLFYQLVENKIPSKHLRGDLINVLEEQFHQVKELFYYRRYVSYVQAIKEIELNEDEDLVDFYQRKLIKNAHPLMLAKLFKSPSTTFPSYNLFLAIRGFFNEESSAEMKEEYKQYICRECTFTKDYKLQRLLELFKALVNSDPLPFRAHFVDAGITYLLRTRYSEQWRVVYEELYARQVGEELKISVDSMTVAELAVDAFKKNVALQRQLVIKDVLGLNFFNSQLEQAKNPSVSSSSSVAPRRGLLLLR